MDRFRYGVLGVLLVLLTACGGKGGGSDAGAGDPDGGAVPLADASGAPADAAAGSETSTVAEDAGDDAATVQLPDGGCVDGETECGASSVVVVCVAGVWTEGETCGAGEVCRAGACRPVQSCTPGEVRGCTDQGSRAVCDERGETYVPDPCPPAEPYCVQGMCDTRMCWPGQTLCETAFTQLHCNADGSGWENPTPCGEGAVCKDGACISGCEAAIKLSSYIGCEYWTVDLDNYHDPGTIRKPDEVPHSVVISNPSHVEATIRFETLSGVAIEVVDPVVPPGDARAFTMPRLDVDGSGITYNSIRILSSMPVNAYQFNPLNNEFVYSNDASLLLPANTLGRRYIAASWPSGPDMSGLSAIPGFDLFVPQMGYVTIVATDGGTTEVTVTPSAAVGEGPGVPALEKGVPHTFTLEQFQVLNLEAAAGTLQLWPPLAEMHDLTGTVIEATKPVAVFGGHEEAVIGETPDDDGGFTADPNDQDGGSCCADHLEEQMLPLRVWRNDILCTKARPRGTSGEERDVWRILSGADDTHITTVPPVEDLDGVTLGFSEWVEVRTALSFELHGTGPLMAVQYLLSQQATEQVKGDPAMVLSVPMGQYRNEYNILVPDGYVEDFVAVIRHAGLPIMVDGVPTPVPFSPIGNGDWEVGYVDLADGVHHLFCNFEFGLIGYGWDGAVSYGYPAGLNLRAEDWAPDAL